MKNNRKVLRGFLMATIFMVAFFVFLAPKAYAATITSVGTGNWSASAWPNTTRTGTITTSNVSPTVTGVGTLFLTQVSVGNIVKTTANVAIGTVASIESNTSLTLTGNAASSNAGIAYNVQGVGSGDAAVVAGGHTVTVDLNASCSSLTLSAHTATYIGVTISGSNALTVSGTVTLTNPGGTRITQMDVNAGTLNAGTLAFAGSGQAGRKSTLTVSTGTVNVSGNITTGGTRAAANNITFSGAGNLNLGGSLGTVLTFTPSTSTFNFNGTSAQTVPTGIATINYNNLHINNTSVGGATLSAAITATKVLGNIRVQTGTLNNGGFAIAIATSKTFEVASGATFNMTGTSGMVTGTTITKTFGATSTVNYGGAAQTVSSETYGHLILGGSSTKTMPATTMTVAGNFSTAGTASATAAAIINFNGNLSVGSGTTFNAGSYSHVLKGNFSNAGTFTASTSTFTLNGTSIQNISGSNSTFNNLTINNSNGVTLTATTPTIGGTLTLTSGNLTTGSNNIYINSTGGVSGGSTGSHVVGNLRKYITNGATNKTFEIGGPTNYTPLDVSFGNVTGANDLTATVSVGDCANIASSTIDANKSVNRCWSVTDAGLTFNNYSAVFNFVAGDLDGTADYNNFVVGKYSGGTWSYPTVGTKNSTNTQITGVTSFSDFQVGEMLDIIPPATPAAPDLDATDDSGASNSDNITSQTANLTFTGTAEASSTVELFDGVLSKGTTVAVGGNYSFTTSLAQGVHVITLTATDGAGNKSATSSPLYVTIDTTNPDTPAIPDLDSADDTGSSNSDNITKNTTGLTFSGTAEASSTVELFDGAVSKGTTTAALGNWSFDVSLAAGDHNMSVVATDLAGNISSASTVLSVQVDTTAPSAPSAPDLDSTDDTGTLDNDNITKLTTGITFSGTAEASSTIEIFAGAVSKGSIHATSSNWSLDISLSEGVHSIVALATDVAGNVSATSSSLSVTVDTSAPAVPSIPDFDAADDTGISNTDNITKQVSNNTFTGTGEIGSTVSLFRQKPGEYFPAGSVLVTDGTWTFNMFINPGTYSLWTSASDTAGNVSATSSSLIVIVDISVEPTPSAPDLDSADDTGISNSDNITNLTSGLTFTGTAEATSTVELFDGAVSMGTTTAALGNWSFDISLSAGDHEMTTVATDIAGNISTTSPVLSLVIDTAAPSTPSVPSLNSADDTGISNSDNITNLTSGLTFTGTAEATSTIVIYDGATSKGTTTAIGGTWSLDISLDAGDHSVSVTSMDTAGNISTSSTALLVSIDTSAPATPAIPDLDTADDTGIYNTDHITKQNANLTFLGTAEASSTVELFYDVTNLKGTTIATGGNWSYTTSLFDGTHGITVTATDVAGNKSATSSSMSITIDTSNPSAPSAPDLATEDDDDLPDDNITSLTDNLTFSGTAEASSTVELFAGATSKGTTTAVLGNWSFDISLSAGTYDMTAVATDVAGNISLASAGLSVTVGSTGFAFPSEPDLDSSDDTGSSNSDNVTKNTTGLTFFGTAEIDSTVVIYDGANPLGTTTAALGNYSFDFSLSSGPHSISVFSYNATSSATSTALSVTIDVSNPATPSTPDFDAADDTGLYDNDNITKNTSNLTYSGTAEADSVVTIYLDDISRGTSVATGGNWSFSGSIPEGTHYLYVTATDLAGNISSNSGSIMMIIDTTQPSAPTAPDLDPADDSGVYDYDNITNVVTGLTFSGTTEASSTIELFDGAVSKGTVFATSGAWILDVSLPVGTHNISAKSTDLAGNISDASTPNVVVVTDVTSPAAPSAPDLDSADDTGSSDFDDITRNTTGLTFTGTAEADMIVEIFDGATSKGTTTAIGGNYSFDISLSAGVHSLTTVAMDVAGNYSSSSAALSVTVDTTAPAIPSIPDLDAADDTGSSNSDNITKQVSNNTFTGTGEIGSTVSLFRQKPGEYFPAGSMLVTDGTWTFNMFINPGVYSLWATAADAAGNVSATSSILSVTVDTSVEPLPSAPDLDSADDTGISNSDNITSRTTGLTFSGTAEANSVIELFDGVSSKGTTTAISGNYSFDISLSAGDHSLTTVATDIAGNISTTSPILSLIIDTSAPAAPGTPDLDPVDDTGSSSSDHITKKTSDLTFYGSGETGSVIEVFDGVISKGTTVASSSNWSLDISLSDGVHSITAVATDAAGNSSLASGAVSITIDTSAPAAPAIIGLDPADDTGISNSDSITKQTSNLTGLGTAENNSIVEIFDGAVSKGTTIATGGNWTIEGSMANGTHILYAIATDAAGNTSASSTTFTLVVDDVLPTVTQVTPVPTPTNDTTPNYTFNSTEAGTITYGGTAGCSSITTSAAVGNNIITFSTLASGAYSCQITVTDVAGNASPILHVNDFTVDTIAPVLSDMTPVPTPTNTTTPSFSFHSSEAGTITYGGTAGCTSTTTSAISGYNTIIFSALGSGTYSCTIRVTDAAGNQSNIFNVNTFVVDLIAPTVTGVTSYANNEIYNFGEIIPIQVNFSEDVVVTGVPQITLTTGSPATTAVDYSSGSGSNSLIFNYTVSTGNLSADLDYSATTALALNGGTIKDEVGNNATLTLATPGAAGSLGANKNIIVDSSALLIVITAPTSASSSAITDTTIHITDSDGVLVSGVSASSSTVAFDSFNCTQTDANTVDCTINITGSGDLTIDALDSLSNPYSATESGYVVDTTFPETSITGNPELTTNSTDATFVFSSSESGTFECRLDGGSYTACSSPYNIYALEKGVHIFEVRAIDDLLNADATPASFSWTIDGINSSSPVPAPPSIGDGQSVVVVPPGESRPLSLIANGGVNVLLYPSSELHAPVLISSTYTQEDHTIRIIDLDLLNNIATIQIESVPVTVKVKLSETANVDLDADSIPDISVRFANLQVNLMELTIKSLLGEKPVVVNPAAYDLALANKLKGRILLQVESHGEAWYINPKDGRKYYMANGNEAYQIMRKLSVGITNSNLNKIKTSAAFRKKFIGKIFLQVESHGEAYYISPDNQYTYLKDGAAAYQIMRKKGLGITNSNINKIPNGVLNR